mmetsp:Transcript_30586/g.60015  ORF Transcript_30586/g.60015 Transcript_30586/m.60015 type:complete len:232 (+) Transcript_30586:28-723(+)
MLPHKMLMRQIVSRCMHFRGRIGSARFSSITVGSTSLPMPREDMTLLQLLRHHAFPMDFECLKGSCKRCTVQVQVEGEHVSVLACQEQALDGMHVILDNAAPDVALARQKEQQAREFAQRQMLARRAKVQQKVAAKPRLQDPRDRLKEVVMARDIMARDGVPGEVLSELRSLLESLSTKEFWDVTQTCKLDTWIKKQSWGKEHKKTAAALREYIYDRENELAAPEVETVAC